MSAWPWPEPEREPLAVGTEVVIRDVNESRLGGPRRGVVTKVGRKLVTVQDVSWGREQVYRLDSRRSNDAYGHASIQTPAEQAEAERREWLRLALRERGVEVRLGWNRVIPTPVMEALWQAVGGEA